MTTYQTSITGTTPFADYTFRVRGVNQQGMGDWSAETAPAQFNYNKATGGIEIPYTESDGSGWMMHKFTTDGTLVVTENPQPFKWRLIGAGGNSGYSDCPNDHGRAGGGGGWYDTEGALPIGSTNMFVGQGGTSHANKPAPGSSIEGFGHVGGGGNGCFIELSNRLASEDTAAFGALAFRIFSLLKAFSLESISLFFCTASFDLSLRLRSC